VVHLDSEEARRVACAAGVSHRVSKATLLSAAGASLVCAVFLAACAKPKVASPAPSATTPDGLELVSGGPFAHEWVRPGVDLSGYRRILLDPVEVSYKKGTEHGPIAPDDLERLRFFFRRAVEKKVTARYPLVTEPAADVLRLRAKVVDLQFRLTFGEIDPTTPFPDLTTYRLFRSVTVIADLRDSQSGERIYLLADEEPVTQAVTPGVETTAVDFWGSIEMAFDAWAHKLDQMLEHAGSTKP